MLYRRLSGLALVFAYLSASCDPNTTISVSSTSDGGEGSLRAAVARANAADPTKSIRIEVPTGTYELTLCGADDTNDAGDLDLTALGPVTIIGIGPDVVIHQTCAGQRVLDALGTGLLTLSSVTLSGGALVETDASHVARGGGVRAAADVTLQQVRFMGNSVTAAPGAAAYGGGLFAGGSVNASAGSFESNTATGQSQGLVEGAAEGGALYVMGAITIGEGYYAENRAQGGGVARGGAVAQAASSAQPVRVSGAQFYDNVAEGGGLSAARGGALALAGVATLTENNFLSNKAVGGSVPVGGGTPSPPGFPIFMGYQGGAAEGGAVWGASALSLNGGSYEGNASTPGRGITGGISSGLPWPGRASGPFDSLQVVHVNGGTYTGNSGGDAPGFNSFFSFTRLGVITAPTATVRNATFESNNAGAVAVSGDLQVFGTELRNNAAGFSAASLAAEGVTLTSNENVAFVSGVASFSNATITNNRYGIVAEGIELRHVTIVGNQNESLLASRLKTHASIVLDTFSGLTICRPDMLVEESSYNWFSDSTCALAGEGDRQGSPLFTLQPLGDYGGTVRTRPPSFGSVLVDAIPASACALSQDARGVLRPQGRGCDIGAVESLSIAGVGPTNLAISFEQHAPVAIGTQETWRLVVRNRGPNAALPYVRVSVPGGLRLDSMLAAGASCASGECTWSSPLAARAQATLDITGTVWSNAEGDLHWAAKVAAQNLLPPLTDDEATLVTPLAR